MPQQPGKKTTVQLKPAEMKHLIEVAHRAISSGDFMKGCEAVPDARKAYLKVADGGKSIERECKGAVGAWRARKSNTAELFNLINQKLPKDFQD